MVDILVTIAMAEETIRGNSKGMIVISKETRTERCVLIEKKLFLELKIVYSHRIFLQMEEAITHEEVSQSYPPRRNETDRDQRDVIITRVETKYVSGIVFIKH